MASQKHVPGLHIFTVIRNEVFYHFFTLIVIGYECSTLLTPVVMTILSVLQIALRGFVLCDM